MVKALAADPMIDGLELVLKGGQMGSDDFLERVGQLTRLSVVSQGRGDPGAAGAHL